MQACPSCGYASNRDDALVCNLCRAVLRPAPKAKPAPASVSPPTQPPTYMGTRHTLRGVGGPPRVLDPAEVLTIGRSPDAGLVIQSNRVSRFHAEIRFEGGVPVLVDRGSSNGSFVNGERVTARPLRTGDEIEIGPFFCTYVLEGGSQSARLSQSSEDGGVTRVVQAGSGVMAGQITDVAVAEVLQSIELNEKTGTLEVQGAEGSGWIACQDGRPIAAELTRKREKLVDLEAALAIVNFTAGRFAFQQQLPVWENRMRTSVTGLLLEAGRRKDQAAEEAAKAAAMTPAASGPYGRPPTGSEETVTTGISRHMVAPTDSGSGTSDDILARAAGMATRAIKRLDRLYFISNVEEWAEAQGEGKLSPVGGAPLLMSSAGQLVRRANLKHRGQRDLVVLVIDPRKAGSPVRWEDPGDGQRVPQLQAALPLEAVVETHTLEPGPDGAFTTPAWLIA